MPDLRRRPPRAAALLVAALAITSVSLADGPPVGATPTIGVSKDASSVTDTISALPAWWRDPDSQAPGAISLVTTGSTTLTAGGGASRSGSSGAGAPVRRSGPAAIEGEGRSLEPEVDHAFVRETFGSLAAFYRLGILADGYPARRIDGVLVPHPLYGTYVLDAYVSRYQTAPTDDLRQGMLAFARVAIARMEPFRGALVFRNPPELGFVRASGRRYSGLTMAYYARLLARVARITGDAGVSAAADACFRSLLIPEASGGVLYRWADGQVAIAEAPGEPADLTLNGWLSALAAIAGYAETTGAHEAATLVQESAATVARLLPLYDVRGLRLSRYALSGRVTARLVVEDPRAVTFSSVRLAIPGDRSYPVAVGGRAWSERVVAADVIGSGPFVARRRIVDLGLVLSRLSYPRRNVLVLRIHATRRTTIRLDVLSGPTDPTRAGLASSRWHRASTVTVGPGDSTVRLAIPWSLADHAAPLTNWAHVIDGRAVNIYHPIHVRRLEELAAATGVAALARWASTWRADMCAWSRMPRYAGLYATDDGGRVVRPGLLCASR